MTCIAIFGDSWSYQSFQKLPNFQESKGTQTFQSMFGKIGINAINYSQPGCSCQDIINTIEKTELSKFNFIIVFQTDPLRNIIDRKKFNPNLKFSNYTNIVDIAESILLKFYQHLSQVEIPVILVGGLSKVAYKLVPANISTLDRSWTELADSNFEDCYFEWTDFTDLVCDFCKCNKDIDYIHHQIQAKNYIWQTSDAFGWCHPSDKGYDIMFNSLNTHLKAQGLL